MFSPHVKKFLGMVGEAGLKVAIKFVLEVVFEENVIIQFLKYLMEMAKKDGEIEWEEHGVNGDELVRDIRIEMGYEKPNPNVFFDVSINKKAAGRIVMELDADVVPKTAANFLALCTGEKENGKSGKPLHFKGSKFHIITRDLIHGGDFVNGDGTGGESIYGEKFEDENFTLNHSGPGVLSMIKDRTSRYDSQFAISIVQTTWLDGKHVVFGRVTQGMDVVTKIKGCGTDSGKPISECVIADCGQL